eukprot:CAMPEP_0118878462 /NCGR_PEP_ID=MMETSP1163-20130328/18377_1 /TAXON_ID=124430 /ORGANISM="Phaeomonas parva, Strain CCMP2877" /LENGTH=343 /DNA_ID=CAMNT_0006814307 /DNA_START=265 /DNA_END=1292 /DNA_ORIENTATION=-
MAEAEPAAPEEAAAASPPPPEPEDAAPPPLPEYDGVSRSWTGGRGSKIAVRYIPTEVTEEAFLAAIAQWTPVKPLTLMYFVPGKTSRKRGRCTGQAYLLFEEDVDAERFAQMWNASNPYATPQTGATRVPSIAVAAPSQRLFRRQSKKKKDRVEGTIDKDPVYAAFLQSLSTEGVAEAVAEAARQAEAAAAAAEGEGAAMPAVVQWLAKHGPPSKDAKGRRGKGGKKSKKDKEGSKKKGKKRGDDAKADGEEAGGGKGKKGRERKSKKKRDGSPNPNPNADADANPNANPKPKRGKGRKNKDNPNPNPSSEAKPTAENGGGGRKGRGKGKGKGGNPNSNANGG